MVRRAKNDQLTFYLFLSTFSFCVEIDPEENLDENYVPVSKNFEIFSYVSLSFNFFRNWLRTNQKFKFNDRLSSSEDNLNFFLIFEQTNNHK